MPEGPVERRYKNCIIEIACGDIAAQADMECVVNAANAALKPGGGVAGALHAAAGRELEEACRPWAPLEPGQAVITPGFKLPNRWVIHCLGPRYGVDEPAAALLRDCYVNALGLCDRHGIESVGFPALSTGAFGYPLGPAADVAVDAILELLPGMKTLQHLRFVLLDEDDLDIFGRSLERLWRDTVKS